MNVVATLCPVTHVGLLCVVFETLCPQPPLRDMLRYLMSTRDANRVLSGPHTLVRAAHSAPVLRSPGIRSFFAAATPSLCPCLTCKSYGATCLAVLLRIRHHKQPDVC